MRRKKIITLRILFDLTPISWGKNYKKCTTDSEDNLYFDFGSERLFRFETQLNRYFAWKTETGKMNSCTQVVLMKKLRGLCK